MLITSTAAILLAIPMLSMPGPEKPLPLMGLEAARANLQTGRVVWRTLCNAPRQSGIVPRWHFYDTPRFFNSTLTPGQYMVEDFGDPRGVVFPTDDGSPHFDVGCLPVRYLLCDGAQWEQRELTGMADCYKQRNDLLDVRTLGLTAGLALGLTVQDAFLALEQHTGWEVRRVGDLYEVRIGGPSGRSWLAYVLDPARGWNPVSVTRTVDGKVLSQARSTLKQYGDVWFPQRVELYSQGHKDGAEPEYVIEVLSASFNEPDQRRRLTPEDIGVDVGTNVWVYPHGLLSRTAEKCGWDGAKLIPYDELATRISAGELHLGPRFMAAVERSQAVAGDLTTALGDWERYVRRFIRRYDLTAEQTEQALKVLRDCQEQGAAYLRRQQAEIDRVRAAVRGVVAAKSATQAAAPATIAELKEQMLRLRAPVDEIFYVQLVPRLGKLPTRAQREGAAGRDELNRNAPSSSGDQR